MFETLQDRLQGAFQKLTSRGKLSESDVKAALREVRLALLEADVNYKVVKDFVARVQERAVGQEVMDSLAPGQQVIKIVHEELIATLGQGRELDLSGPTPHVIMLVGLHGSGKTTQAAKLALRLREEGHYPMMVAADTRRPAAITQLEVLGRQIDVPVYEERNGAPPPLICEHAVGQAQEMGRDVVILDTGGRLHIDEELMTELARIRERTEPCEVLLVADAMTGQDAVRTASDFHERAQLTGLILTKMDGDARGGAAISIRSVTGVPILFIGVGEKLDALEPFYPDRLASRILGMGDVLTLIEKAEATLDQEKAIAAGEKILSATFTLEDFLDQMQEIRKMGPVSSLMEMIPGFAQMGRQVSPQETDEQFKRVEAMINSMTLEERRKPRIINASRRRRIARGSGTTVQEINQLLKQFRQMQKLMKQLSKGRGRGLASMFPGLGGRF
ncbi:MAG: signal recognition particle protein [Chloroflexota bacterium]|nr:signal recognition particle protein [Chloroflexota bacterium]